MDGHKSLRVYQLAYELAMEIFHLTRTFPIEERFSLVDQIRRSSRAVAETQTWLDFSLDCGYISIEKHSSLYSRYKSVGSMLGKMIQNPEQFIPRKPKPRI